MSGDISEALSRLRAASPRLNDASDQLSKTISLVEQALAELNLGVFAFAGFPPDSRDNTGNIEGISYEKLENQWSICYTHGSDFLVPEDWKVVRLAAAARDIRLRVVACDLIPKLLSQLAEEAEKKVGEVENAALYCEEIAATLKPAAPTPKPKAPTPKPRPAPPPPLPVPPALPKAPPPPTRPAPTKAPPPLNPFEL